MKNRKGFTLFLVAISILNPLFSLSQSTRIPANEMRKMHHETIDDAYIPNAYNNKKFSPSYKYWSPAKTKLTKSIITITQVNVDSTGKNILGDAANEPNIAVNPLNPNNIVIGWRQFDNVTSNFRQAGWSYSTDAGHHWTFPGEIEAGIFRSDPVLDFDSAGNFYYNSLTFDFTCKVFQSTNGGATWNNGTAAGGGDKQWMTIDRTPGSGSGNIYSFWSSAYSTCSPGSFTRSWDGNNSYESCSVLDGDPFWGTLAVGNAGELYIAGADTLSDSLVVLKSLNAQIGGSILGWNTPVYVFMDGYIGYASGVNPQGLIGQVSVDVDRSNGPGRGNLYVLASLTRISNSDTADVMFAKSTDGGITWSSPIRINDDTSATNMQWFGTMSVAPNGRIDAVWLDTRNAPAGSDSSALYYSYSIDQGNTWSANEKLSNTFDPHIGYPNQNKMGDYFDMVSDNTGAHLAWTNTFNGEEDVYYSYIIPQIATGVNEISDNATFTIFPNPGNGVFFITSDAKQSLQIAASIEIFTILGEKVYSKKISQTISEIDISSQPAGIYFLKISNQDGSKMVEKIIKE